MAFCRHLLGSREDAEDVLQEVMTAAFNAILADDRPINVRPWLYRIARNRSLNHLRRAQAIGVDSMDHHLSEHGATTADKVHEREEFRLLVGDIHELPETQKTALVLREMDALSYEQIAEAMETTVPSVKSLLVRARVSLAEAAEARLLSCDQVRIELAEVAEGLQRRPSPLVRRHLRSCKRCSTFRAELKKTNRALAALLPGRADGGVPQAPVPAPGPLRRVGLDRLGDRGRLERGRAPPAPALPGRAPRARVPPARWPADDRAGRWRGGGLQRAHLRGHRRPGGQGGGRAGGGGARHRRRRGSRAHDPPPSAQGHRGADPGGLDACRRPSTSAAPSPSARSYAEPRSTVAAKACRHARTPAPAPTRRRR